MKWLRAATDFVVAATVYCVGIAGWLMAIVAQGFGLAVTSIVLSTIAALCFLYLPVGQLVGWGVDVLDGRRRSREVARIRAGFQRVDDLAASKQVEP